MTSKEKILNSIRENNIVKDVKLPSYENFGIKFDNKFETFSTMLESVGGKALVIEKEDLDKTIKELYPDEKIIASNAGSVHDDRDYLARVGAGGVGFCQCRIGVSAAELPGQLTP